MGETGLSPPPLTKDQQLRAVFEHAGVGIAVTALDGRFVETNHRFCEILGYSAEALRARTFLDVTYPDELEATRAYMNDLLAGRIPSYKLGKYRRFKLDEIERWLAEQKQGPRPA